MATDVRRLKSFGSLTDRATPDMASDAPALAGSFAQAAGVHASTISGVGRCFDGVPPEHLVQIVEASQGRSRGLLGPTHRASFLVRKKKKIDEGMLAPGSGVPTSDLAAIRGGVGGGPMAMR